MHAQAQTETGIRRERMTEVEMQVCDNGSVNLKSGLD